MVVARLMDKGAVQDAAALQETELEAGKRTLSDERPRLMGKQSFRDQKLQSDLAIGYVKLGETDEAIQAWKDLVDWERLAEALEKQGDQEQAVELWKKLVEQNPSDWSLQGRLAEALEKQGFQEQALELWKKLVKQNPSNRLLQEQLAGALEKQGDQEQRMADWRPLHFFGLRHRPYRDSAYYAFIFAGLFGLLSIASFILSLYGTLTGGSKPSVIG